MPDYSALLGAVNKINQQKQQQEEFKKAIALAMMKGQIEAQTQQLDPSQIMSQLELRNIVNALRQSGQLGGQATGQPTPGQGGNLGGQGIPPPISPQVSPQPQIQPQIAPQGLPRQPGINLQQPQGQLRQGISLPQPIAPGQPGQQPPQQFIRISEGTDKFGVPKYKTVKNPAFELYEKRQVKQLEKETKIAGGQRAALANFNLVSNAFAELADTYASAVREGGVGSKKAQLVSGARLFLGGEQAEQFPSTSALPGQRTEVIARMMPILTAQGDKPGSVRLVSTVFDKLSLTVPQDNTPPLNARKMLEKSLLNMYRFARASQQMGLTNESIANIPDAQLSSISAKVANLANGLVIKGSERQQIDKIINTALQPIDNLIGERNLPGSKGIRGLGQVKQTLKSKYGLE